MAKAVVNQVLFEFVCYYLARYASYGQMCSFRFHSILCWKYELSCHVFEVIIFLFDGPLVVACCWLNNFTLD